MNIIEEETSKRMRVAARTRAGNTGLNGWMGGRMDGLSNRWRDGWIDGRMKLIKKPKQNQVVLYSLVL